MKGTFLLKRSRAALLFCLLPLTLTGCQSAPFMEGGPEVRFLTSKAPVVKSGSSTEMTLLPLAVGTTWEMVLLAKTLPRIEGHVVGTDGSGGTLIEFRKNGTLWRRESYKNTPTGLLLTGMGEENKPPMQLVPPVPIFSNPPHSEGEWKSWTGTFQYGKTSYPADAFSRISAIEKIQGPDGKVLTYRVDTQIIVNQNGNLVKFPMIRWFAPGIGFVKRSFVDGGRAYEADLQKFTPK